MPPARTLGEGRWPFIQRFSSALSAHTHFHVCAIDGLFEPDDEGVRFHRAPAPSPDNLEALQTAIRQRTLCTFQRCGGLDRGDRREMEKWHHEGGFSLDALVVISRAPSFQRLIWASVDSGGRVFARAACSNFCSEIVIAISSPADHRVGSSARSLSMARTVSISTGISSRQIANTSSASTSK